MRSATGTEPACSLRRVVFGRLLLAPVLVPLAFVLAAPSGGSLDFDHRHQGGLGGRIIALHRQIDALAQGHYLSDGEGGSFTRDACEVGGAKLRRATMRGGCTPCPPGMSLRIGDEMRNSAASGTSRWWTTVPMAPLPRSRTTSLT